MQYQFPIFENLCPSWEKIAHLGFRCAFARGSQVLSLESHVDGVYYVKEGSVEVMLYTLHGPEKVLFYVGPGCIFGEVSCFVSGADQEAIDEASVIARSDCVLYYFSREVIEGPITNQHPRLLLELIRATSYKIRMYGVLLRDSLSSDNFTRVCKMLVYLVRFRNAAPAKNQKWVVIRPEMTQSDMARLMGVHRVTVTKAISRLKSMGILQHFSKGSLIIPDFPALCQIIEQEDL
jgi:CRP-like cAMP-binding protein